MIDIDSKPFSDQNASLRRRVGITCAVLLAIITLLTVIVALKPAPDSRTAEASAGLLFLRNPTQSAELWLSDVAGQQVSLLVPAVSDFSSSPDGTQVVYATQAGTELSRIEIIDLATRQTQIVVQSADFVAFNPQWSPASGPGVIVYERRAVMPDGIGSSKLWLVKEDGTDLGAVIRGGEVVAYGAKWSPDGSKLAFVDPLRSEIVVFNFSSQLRRVPLNGEFDWSPDGSKLVISAFPLVPEGMGDTQLYIYDLTTGTQQVLFVSPGNSAYMPRWSPDGSQIAFVRRSRLAPQGAIWVGRLADNMASMIDPAAQDLKVPLDDTDPQWSPVGDQLIWTRVTLGAQHTPATIWSATMNGSTPAAPLIENALQARWIQS